MIKPRGVSPVIGIILLTAVTVALVSLAAFFVFDVGSSSSNSVGTPTVTAEYESESRIDVSLLKQGSADRVVVRSALGTEYVLDETGETVTLLNQDGNQTPVVLGEKDGKRTVLRSVPPRSFSPDIVVTNGSDGTHDSVSSALADVESNDIVVLKKDVYYENIEISTPNVTLVGESGTVIADNSSDSSVINVKAGGVRIANIDVNASSIQGETAADHAIQTITETTVVNSELRNGAVSNTDGDVSQVSSTRFVPDTQINSEPIIIPNTVSRDWVNTYDSGGLDKAQDVVVDENDDVIVTGYTDKSGTNDYYTIKYDSSGNEIWNQTYDSGGSDRAYGIAVESDNDIIVSGGSPQTGTESDYYIIKYDSGGNEIWNQTYSNGDNAYDVAVGPEGSILVTGRGDEGGSDDDYYTVKYNSAGEQQWAREYNVSGSDSGRAVGVDSAGNIYVTGETGDFVTLKYNSSGSRKWIETYDGGGPDQARSLVIDSNDDVIITGNSYSYDSSSANYYTIKYTKEGREVWNQSYDSGDKDYPFAVTTDAKDNVYVHGHSIQSGSDYDAFTIRYTDSGQQKWTETYNGSAERDIGLGADATDDGTVYVAGYAGSTGNYTVIRYSG